MKKVLFALLCLSLTVSCKKETDGDGEQTYEERLEGTWDLKSVYYETDFPNPSNPLEMLHVEGDGEDVSGVFDMNLDPNTFIYNYDFTANVTIMDTVTFPVPIQRSGNGTWTTTTDGSKIFITEDNQEYVFNVVVNEQNRQVFTTTVQQTIQSIFTIDVDLKLEFVR